MKIINRNNETIMGKYDYPIDHIFFLNNNKYIAIVSTEFNCTKCSFHCRRECTSVKCYRNERSDAQSIIFEKVT